MLVITGNKGNTATVNVDPEIKFPLTELVDHKVFKVCPYSPPNVTKEGRGKGPDTKCNQGRN